MDRQKDEKVNDQIDKWIKESMCSRLIDRLMNR